MFVALGTGSGAVCVWYSRRMKLSAQAVLLATNARLCLGEDALNAGAALESDPGAAASVRAQDWLRVLAVLGLLAGAILKLLGVWQ